MNTLKVKQCSNCGGSFDCGDSAPDKKCWCNDFPPIFTISENGDCLCSNCFKDCCSIKIEEYVSTITPQTALTNKAKELPKTQKIIEGIDYYLEDGNYVFKAWFHLKRGSCCGNGCRHCPY